MPAKKKAALRVVEQPASKKQKINTPVKIKDSQISGLLRANPEMRKATKIRSDAYSAFLMALKSEPVRDLIRDDEAFCDLVGMSIQDYGVKQKELAEMIGLTTAGVGRWVGHKSVPKPYARQMVVEVIHSLITKNAQEFAIPIE